MLDQVAGRAFVQGADKGLPPHPERRRRDGGGRRSAGRDRRRRRRHAVDRRPRVIRPSRAARPDHGRAVARPDGERVLRGEKPMYATVRPYAGAADAAAPCPPRRHPEALPMNTPTSCAVGRHRRGRRRSRRAADRRGRRARAGRHPGGHRPRGDRHNRTLTPPRGSPLDELRRRARRRAGRRRHRQRRALVGTGTDRKLYHRTATTGWHRLSDGYCTDVSAATGDGVVHLSCRGGNGALYAGEFDAAQQRPTLALRKIGGVIQERRRSCGPSRAPSTSSGAASTPRTPAASTSRTPTPWTPGRAGGVLRLLRRHSRRRQLGHRAVLRLPVRRVRHRRRGELPDPGW